MNDKKENTTRQNEILAKRIARAREKLSKDSAIIPEKNTETNVLSYAQIRFWLQNQLQQNNTRHNRTFALKLTGIVNVASLEAAIGKITERHSVLRSVIRNENAQPSLSIRVAGSFLISKKSVSADTPSRELDEVRSLIEYHCNISIDFETGPLLNALVINATEYSVLVIVTHHMAFDAWSEEIFKRELIYLYDINQNTHSETQQVIPTLTAQYSDFSSWQNSMLEEQNANRLKDYWLGKLQNTPHILDLPKDYARSADLIYHSDQYFLELPHSLTDYLKTFSQAHHVSLFMTMISAFFVLIYRYTSQKEFLIGAPVSGRLKPEFENLIGYFVNTLVLKVNMDEEVSFIDFLKDTKNNVLEALEHQVYPVEKIFENLHFERSTDRSPLYQVLFNMENIPHASLHSESINIEQFPISQKSMAYDLMFDIKEENSKLGLAISYKPSLYNRSTIKRMAGHYQTILSHIIEQSGTIINRIPLLTHQEYQKVVIDWNDIPAEPIENICVHELFERQVRKTPDEIALIVDNREYTYNELNKRSNQLAMRLLQLDINPGESIGICYERSFALVVAIIATLKVGATIVPLDPGHPGERLLYQLIDTDAKLLICSKNTSEKLTLDNTCCTLRLDLVIDNLGNLSQKNPEISISSKLLACLLYTSGSSGKPKGVMIEHQNLTAFIVERCKLLKLGTEDKSLHTASFTFDAAFGHLFSPLCSGAACVLISINDVKTRIAETIEEYGITYIPITTALLETIPPTNFPKLRIISVAGEKCSIELAKRWGKRQKLYNIYGPTETTIGVTVWLYRDGFEICPIGKPAPNNQMYILDQHLQPVPVGVMGELYIGGRQVARGYLNLPELTAEKFIDNPFGSGKLYKTGDQVKYLEDGNIDFIGRNDSQVKIRGHRIEKGEIESTLLRRPEVYQTVVDFIDGKLVAFCVYVADVKKPDDKPENLLIQYLSEQLPAYMLPYQIVAIKSLPLTSHGKIDFAALKLILHRQPVQTRVIDRHLTNTEIIVSEIWKDLLNIVTVQPDENFFDLGGHSLIAMRVIADLQKKLHIRAPVSYVFECPTIEELAASLDKLQ